MWSYYGTKKKIVKYYPDPIYDTIIEPFCGAAQYSLYKDNWKKNIILIDKYDVIIDLWKYLISANSNDILSLPDLEYGDSLNDYKYLSKEERYLIGFSINNGSAQPKLKAQKFNNWKIVKKDISDNLYKIKHWNIICGDYACINNIKATWFIDPPYQNGGKWYKYSNIKYDILSTWCKDRLGQTIVCENSKANWLDFNPLVNLHGQLHNTKEVIYYQIKE